MKVVVIDDAPEVSEVIDLCFKLRWPRCTVLSTLEGTQGVKLVAEESPDVVILDIGLPDIDGFEVCRQICRFSDVPLLFLTVRDWEMDIIRGLELGANDYITKPFSHIELLARVQAVLRRARNSSLFSQGKPVLHFFIELKSSMAEALEKEDLHQNLAAELLEIALHRSLKSLDPSYADLEKMLGLKPLKVTILPTGSFQQLYKARKAQGISDWRVPHLNAPDSLLQDLICQSARSLARS